MKKHALKMSVYVLSLILPYLLSITYMVLLVESITFIGFIKKYLGVTSLYFLIVSVVIIGVLGVILMWEQKVKLTVFNEMIIRLQTLLLLPVATVYYLLQLIEESNYPNFIYSTIHLQPANIRYILILNVIVTIFSIFLSNRPFIYKTFFASFKTSFSFTFLLRFLLLFFLSIYVVTNAVTTLQLMFSRTYAVLIRLSLTHDQKMRETWGVFYDHMQLVKEVTPGDAVIAIPPAQNHWLTDGNAAVVRYFLLPRTIVNMKETNELETLYSFPEDDFQYILLSKGSWPDPTVNYGWPKVQFQATKIYYLYGMNGEQTEVVEVDYFDPSAEKNQNSLGVIEL